MAGVKGQSNSEIAGSPESYLGSASDEYYWGRALFGLGVIPTYQPHANSNTSKYYPGDTAGANVRREEGNKQTMAKVPKFWLSGKRCGKAQTARCWLRSSHHLKKA